MFKYFSVILAFIVVMLILLLTTKYLTYKSKKMLKGNYMQIIETLSLGVNNRLHLIKVDKDFYIISSTNKNVEFLSKVNIDDYSEEELKNPLTETIDFKTILNKYLNGVSFLKHKDSQTKNTEKPDQQFKKESDEIRTDGINFKENLEKLKHLNKSINNQWSENGQKKES